MIAAQIDRAFYYALPLIGVFFALLFVYRWATVRWLKPV